MTHDDADAEVPLSRGVPETVLPEPPPSWQEELAAATGAADPIGAVASVVRAHPSYLEAWAELAERAPIDVEAYAYARVGYHRGLDALRAAGWRGSGYVRWRHPTNRGFLRSLDALRRAAKSMGEDDEQERCRQFLRQLDPSWTAAD